MTKEKCKKYLGKVIDGAWKVIEIFTENKNVYVRLENIYNARILKMKSSTFEKIINKETAISKIIKHHLDQKRLSTGLGYFPPKRSD